MAARHGGALAFTVKLKPQHALQCQWPMPLPVRTQALAKLRLAPRSSTGSLRLGHGRRPLGCCGPAQAWGCDSDAPRPHAHRSRADSQPRPPSRQPEPDCGVAPGWLLLASGLSRLQRDNRRDGPASLHPVFNVHGAVFNVHGADSNGGRGLGLEQTY